MLAHQSGNSFAVYPDALLFEAKLNSPRSISTVIFLKDVFNHFSQRLIFNLSFAFLAMQKFVVA